MTRLLMFSLAAAITSMTATIDAADVPATWQTSRRDDGVIVHTIESAYQSQPTKLLVLLPDKVDSDRKLPVLFVLPVEAGLGVQWGDRLAEIRRHDLHNKHGLMCVLPTFADLPWFADHPTNPSLRQESYFIDVILPLLHREYPDAHHDAEGRLLVGFSKSGWGAWSLLLRHPDLFSRAAAWDAPLTMTWPGKYGSRPIFGTADNFAQYEITKQLDSAAERLGDEARLIHLGYGNFRDHHERMEAMLQERGIPHVYRDGPQRRHHWNSGWLPEAVALLVQHRVAGHSTSNESAP